MYSFYKLYISMNSFPKKFIFLSLFETETEHMSEGGAERGGKRERVSEAGSALQSPAQTQTHKPGYHT